MPSLPQTKSGRIKLAAAVVGVLLLVWLIWPSGDTQPEIPVQTAAPVEKPIPPAPPNAENSTLILELFSPSDQALTNQITRTTLSEQIEQTLTVTFILTKCRMISQDDYRDVFRALIMYAEQVKLAPDAKSAEALVRQIAESSSASYALVYSRTSCTDVQLPTLVKQTTTWATQMLNQP